MAQKLTEQGQQTLTALTKALSRNLPTTLRSASGGIASKMVRLHTEVLDEDALTGILAGYGNDGSAFEQLAEAGVLVRAADGGYLIGELSQQLAVRSATELAAPSSQDSTEPAAPAKRRARSRRGFDRDAAGRPVFDRPDVARHDAAEQPAAPQRPRESSALAKAACVRKQTPELNSTRLAIIDLDPRLWINGWLLARPPRTRRSSASCAP